MSKRTGDDREQLTDAQILLGDHLLELGLEPVFEYRFADRRWKFDIVLVEQRIGIECNGGRWTGGHYRGKKVDDEYEKLNTAQLMGWKVMQFTNEFISDSSAREFLRSWLTPEKK